MQAIARMKGKKKSVTRQEKEIRIYAGVQGQTALGLDQWAVC